MLAAAVVIGRQLWLHYMTTPWTRDGRVRADIINVAADVPGYVVDVPVKDNQRVKKGDLLIQIDPEHYQLAVDQAKAQVASRKATWEMRKVNAKRRADMDNLVISKENRDDASNIANSAQADYQQALAELAAAELNLKRTHIVATVDGYVTNLNIHKGDYARTGEAVMAVVDENSFWVYGFFEETKLPHVKVGDQAELQMMSGERIKGHVESIARGIYDRDNPQSRELVADVNPTFNWVRLAQRVPVRIHIDEVPVRFFAGGGDDLYGGGEAERGLSRGEVVQLLASSRACPLPQVMRCSWGWRKSCGSGAVSSLPPPTLVPSLDQSPSR
ncbi:secretion protein HlyD family protein [Pseudomonas putida S11]|nr:secretion protein HlyD family protein [Pseudomonas putida S11]